ncbi:DUF2442 domain-containing protein [Rhizobium cremeum]|uniref:DUF2442 domain-containing protein n=1 Tax=Rhizobium cremeum TaxID=2813827 RepID=UPI000DE4233E
MADLTDKEIDDALERGRALRATSPRARSARYDRESGRIVVDLTNDCVFAFPARLAQGLADACEQEISRVEILGGGTALHWEGLDTDLALDGLMAGLFGTASFMAARAGRTVSPAKSAAARANGTKGGRPPKTSRNG